MSPIPAFEWGGSVTASESYTDNARGIAGGSQSDYISAVGLNVFLREHSRRVVLDANYSFGADYYAQGSIPIQISNHLLAVGSVVAIPDYLTINARAFATPVVISDVGIVTAGNRVVPNGYRNSYGYYVQPELTLRLGEIATSTTAVSYGSTFFISPAGSSPGATIPGLPGPQDTNQLLANQIFSSGEYFNRLNWKVAGAFSETKRKQGLLSEEAGEANFRYALSHEYSLLATVGYDAVNTSRTSPLTTNISGPVFMGGFDVTFGDYFSFQAEAGVRYKNPSYVGSLRYELTPTASLVGSATDTVTTPEGLLLNNLTNLTSTGGGSVSSFNPGSGNLSFDQNISRNQIVRLSFLKDFERNHVDLSLFDTSRTILSPVAGPPKTNSWGGELTLSRDISPRLKATAGGSYTLTEELGGSARNYSFNARLNYQLARTMEVYLDGHYLDRHSSAELAAHSPLTGNLNDYRIRIGLSYQL